MPIRRLGWHPRATAFVRWTLSQRRTTWQALRRRHGVSLPGRVYLGLRHPRFVSQLIAVPAADLDRHWRTYTRRGWRCTILGRS